DVDTPERILSEMGDRGRREPACRDLSPAIVSDGVRIGQSDPSYLNETRSLVRNVTAPPSPTSRSCCTTSATRRSRTDSPARFTAIVAASSHDWLLVPMISMTL